MGNAFVSLILEAARRIESKLVLKDYDTQYAPLVAKAYDARPVLESDAVPSWTAAMTFTEKMFKQIQSRVRVEFVDEDPYQSYEQMNEEVKKTGVLKVWKGESDKHPVWTPEQNWKFRAVHDHLSHIAGGHRFTLKGELASYNRHVKTYPKAAWMCLFVEIVGQTSSVTVNGTFPVQKVTKLHGFDLVNVGNVDEAGYAKNFEEDK